MSNSAQEFNAVYRNYSGMGPVVEVLEHAGIWKQCGVQPGELSLEHSPSRAEERLFAGEIDLIFGNHVSPYLHLAGGKPIVCLSETKNYDVAYCVSREPIDDLRQLEGKRVAAGNLLDEQGRFSSHPRADVSLYLQRAGAREDQITFVPEEHGNGDQLVAAGDADATFVLAPFEVLARRLGLHLLPLEPLPMAFGMTITTLTPNVNRNPELFERLIRALMAAIAFFRTEREKTIDILTRTFGPRMRWDAEMIDATYEFNVGALEPTLYPRAESIMNAFQLATMIAPDKVRGLNPLALWDLHYLRKVHETPLPSGA